MTSQTSKAGGMAKLKNHSLMPFTPSWHVGQQRVPSTSGDPLP